MAPFVELFVLVTVSVCFALVSSTCNVEDPGTTENIFDLSSFDGGNRDLVNVIFPAKIVNDTQIGSYVRLVEVDHETSPPSGGVIGTFWFNEKQRLGDGFLATFKFRIQGPGALSDGFAFVAQNDKINNIFGGNGPNLGFQEGLNNYIAVGFDFCKDRNDAQICEDKEVFVATQAGPGTNEILGSSAFNISTSGSEFVNARIAYAQNTQQLRIFVDDMVTPVLVQNNVSDIRELWGEEFSFFGFTASNLNNAPADIDIKDFRIDQLKSGARIVTGLDREYDFGTRVTFTLVVVDSCNAAVGPSQTLIQSAANISATLTQESNGDPFVLDAIISETGSGTFRIQFDLPENLVASWTLEVKYNNQVLVQNNPIGQAIGSKTPDPPGLSKQNLIILCSIIALLVIAVSYWIRRLYRYKKKLDENKDQIEAGQTFVKIREIEKDISYNMNPLLGTLDEMKDRLAKNKKILESYERGEGLDSQYTIEQLQKQNDKLRSEMNRLKQEEQETAALKGNAVLRKMNKKKIVEFEQEQA